MVPAWYFRDDLKLPVYYIARGDNGWMDTSPDLHNAYVSSVDHRLSEKVKPLIRFVKAWKFLCNVPISSFYLELRVAKYCDGEKSVLYYIDLYRVLRDLLACNLADMRDPMGISGYIKPCSTEARLQDALSKLHTAATRAEKARSAILADKISEGFYWYDLLFNHQFPPYYY